MISLFVASTDILLRFTQSEENSFEVLQRIEFKQELTEVAAKLVCSVVRYKIICKKYPENEKIQNLQLGKIKYIMKQFQQQRNKKRLMYKYDSPEDKILNCIGVVNEKGEGLLEKIDALDEFCTRITTKGNH